MAEVETWNMATATLKRLSWLMDRSCMAAQTGNYGEWFNVLRDMRRNIFPFMEETEWEVAEKKWNELPGDWRLGPVVNPKHIKTIAKILDEIYILYISTMKKKGLLMPKAKDDSKSIVEM